MINFDQNQLKVFEVYVVLLTGGQVIKKKSMRRHETYWGIIHNSNSKILKLGTFESKINF